MTSVRPDPSIPEFEPPNFSKSLKAGLWAGAVGIGVLVMAMVAISQTQWGEGAFSDLVVRARPVPLLCAILVMSTAMLFMGLRWRALLPPPHRPPALGMTMMICAGMLMNHALPGAFGELGSAWLADRRYKIGLAASFAAIMAGRVVGLTSAAFLAAITWWVADIPTPDGFETAFSILAGLIAMGGLCLVWLCAAPMWWKERANTIFRFLSRVAFLRRPCSLVQRVFNALADALVQVATLGPRAFLRSAGWALAGHTAAATSIGLAAWGLDASPSIPGIVFTYATATASHIVLFAFPGSQVSWDMLFGSLLVTTADIALTDALAITMVVRAEQLLVMILGGVALAWLVRGARN